MKYRAFFLIVLCFITSSCAYYDSQELCLLTDAQKNSSGVSVAAKAFTKSDCKKYLDRDVICKGYQPVQIYIDNTTDTSYLFSLEGISLPSIPAEVVSKKVHISSTGRIAEYGAAALLASPLFAIPAVVEGFKSAEANDSLDHNFQVKAAHDCVIAPHSYANMILFVPKNYYHDTFTITLLEETTHEPINLTASAHSLQRKSKD